MSGTSALVTAGALASISMAYKLGNVTSFLLGRTVEVAAGQAIEMAVGKNEYQVIQKQSVQYILMELDVEARISSVRALIRAIQGSRPNYVKRQTDDSSEDFVKVSINHLNEIMNEIMETLHTIYDELDAHAQRWFNNWRRPYVFEDLDLLRAQCSVFDKRLDTLIKCLNVPMHHDNHERSVQEKISSHASELSKFAFGGSDLRARDLSGTSSRTFTTETIFYKDDAVLL